MDCIGCGFGIESGFAFCPKCGRRISGHCPRCHYACAPEFAFCPKCGAGLNVAAAHVEEAVGTSSLSAPSTPSFPQARMDARNASDNHLEGESDRRVVTVLFADLSEFTTDCEALDPEIVRS
jgi:hypothetical protein